MSSDQAQPNLELTSRELALHAARCMSNKGGENIVVLELPEGLRIFDYVVIANGRSERQAGTLAAEVYHFCKRHKLHHQPVEGDQGWRVVDCFDVIVHAFIEEQRGYYDLERLWPEAQALNLEKALEKLPVVEEDEGSNPETFVSVQRNLVVNCNRGL